MYEVFLSYLQRDQAWLVMIQRIIFVNRTRKRVQDNALQRHVDCRKQRLVTWTTQKHTLQQLVFIIWARKTQDKEATVLYEVTIPSVIQKPLCT